MKDVAQKTHYDISKVEGNLLFIRYPLLVEIDDNMMVTPFYPVRSAPPHPFTKVC